MRRELEDLVALKRVLSLVGEGQGVAAALVKVLRKGDGRLRDTARLTLLGLQPSESLAWTAGSNTEVFMLASLVIGASSGDASLLGTKGERLSSKLEGWLKAKEARRMEQKVMGLRVIMISAVMGAVMGMMSSLGPLVGGLSLSASVPPVDPWTLRLFAIGMTEVSSSMLGLFVSRTTVLAGCALSLTAFALVTVAFSPLTAVSPLAQWAIK